VVVFYVFLYVVYLLVTVFLLFAINYVICAIPCLCTVVNVSILDFIDLSLVLSTVSPCSTKGPVVGFFLCCLLDVDVLLNLLFCCCVCGIKKFQNIFLSFEHRNSVSKVIFKSRYYTSEAAAGSFPGCGFFSRPSYIR